jgi:hypothetical protein
VRPRKLQVLLQLYTAFTKPELYCKTNAKLEVEMMSIWQKIGNICVKKLDAEAEFDGFIYVDDDVIAAPEVTGESGDDVTLVDEEDDDDDENAITVTQASNMA